MKPKSFVNKCATINLRRYNWIMIRNYRINSLEQSVRPSPREQYKILATFTQSRRPTRFWGQHILHDTKANTHRAGLDVVGRDGWKKTFYQRPSDVSKKRLPTPVDIEEDSGLLFTRQEFSTTPDPGVERLTLPL